MSDRKLISFQKLLDLLNSNGFQLISIYVTTSHDRTASENKILFLEIRTKTQKSFSIRIPNNYILYESKTDILGPKQIIHICKSKDDAFNQINYIEDIRGPDPEFDILSVSSNHVIFLSKNGDIETYNLGGDDKDKIDSDDEVDDTSMQTLIKKTEKIMKKVNGDKKSRKIKTEIRKKSSKSQKVQKIEGPVPKEDDTDESHERLTIDDAKSTDDHIELEFDDSEQPEEEAPPLVEPPKKLSQNKIVKKNVTLPEDFEDEDILLGVNFYSIDISQFYKEIKNLGSNLDLSITKANETLITNENNKREYAIDDIVDLTSKVSQKIKEEIEEYRKKEKDLADQAAQINVMTKKLEDLQNKVRAKPKRWKDVGEEIIEIQKNLHEANNNLNLETLKSNDYIDFRLRHYRDFLNELLDS